MIALLPSVLYSLCRHLFFGQQGQLYTVLEDEWERLVFDQASETVTVPSSSTAAPADMALRGALHLASSTFDGGPLC